MNEELARRLINDLEETIKRLGDVQLELDAVTQPLPDSQGPSLTWDEVAALTNIPYESGAAISRTRHGLWAYIQGGWEWFTETEAPERVPREWVDQDGHVKATFLVHAQGVFDRDGHERQWAIYREGSREVRARTRIPAEAVSVRATEWHAED